MTKPSQPQVPPAYTEVCKAPSTSKPSKSSTTFLPKFLQKKTPYQKLASKQPQWLWTQTECREWLTAVCIWNLNYTPEKAHEVVERLKGFGPTLFAMKIEHWERVLGDYTDAAAVYALIFSSKTARGAMPKGVLYSSFSTSFHSPAYSQTDLEADLVPVIILPFEKERSRPSFISALFGT
ncbi:uncharacterized protein LY89DRAFT_669280 [Mollisia scopiformis]|uniref:Uncharacterized protein n=1 Tax=Mollisia scopiformis TaxID=149040 RepID=A0A194X9J2_MOLSC|nr:uncharacterized protein LY89DRAFT_669280 [Mollisia scopiformis]KUJ16831.1 hypothetical protein LY89DRAFT_669280 [Mollisia scopiformis]